MVINRETGYAADTTKGGEVVYGEFGFAQEAFNLTSETVTIPEPPRKAKPSAQMELF